MIHHIRVVNYIWSSKVLDSCAIKREQLFLWFTRMRLVETYNYSTVIVV